MPVLKELLENSKDGEWGKSEPFDDSVEMSVIRGTDFESARVGDVGGAPDRFIAKRHHDRKVLKPWDILLETAGGSKNRPTGRTLLVKPSLLRSLGKPATCASFARFLRIDSSKAYPPYVFWMLQHLYSNGVLFKYHTQHTGVARFQYTSFAENEELSLPSLGIQVRIASILSAYDDLIENNTRRIEVLEEMARRLYEEWFVHFRFPGYEEVNFKESELGEIPEGWVVNRLEDVVALNPRTKVPKEGEKWFVPMGALSESSMIVGNLEKKAGNSGAKFQNGDTLFARITPCLENGKTGFVDFLTDDQPTACGSTEFIVMRSTGLCPEMVYLLARSDRFRDVAIKSMSGATGRQRVRVESLRELPVVQPDQATLAAFQRVSSPCFKQIRTLARKNANLRAQRDLLLPKLVSGEIDVSDIPMPDDKEVEAA